MIDELRVENLGVIEDAHLELGNGLVVVTGETGAGKTLLFGALRLLLGSSARGDLIGPHGEEARVEGRFVDGSGEAVASRRLVAGGRSRAYLDGDMVAVKSLTARLGDSVEMIGQHDHLALTKPGSQLRLIDGALDASGVDAAQAFGVAWSRYEALRAAQETLGGDRRVLERELDLARFQTGEIAAADFHEGDEEDLLGQASRLRHAEELATLLGSALDSLERAVGLEHAVDTLARAGGLDPSLIELADETRALQDQLAELRRSVRAGVEGVEHDPAGLEVLEARLALLGDLKRKYGADLTEVLSFGAQAAARADQLASTLSGAERLESDLEEVRTSLDSAAEALSAARRRAAKSLAQAAGGHLRELGFRDPFVEVGFESQHPGPTGRDAVTLLFASDTSLTPGPAARVASGGELSRLVLALRLASGVGEAPVIAFDEIDAGIGGATALAMGEKLAALARGRQVLCVTHLPQVAAHADIHLVVDREGARARVRAVVGDERLPEIARMLSGLPDSERGHEHAAELLTIAGR